MLLQQPIMFTTTACIIASTVVAFLLMYQSVKTGLESNDSLLEDAASLMSQWRAVTWH